MGANDTGHRRPAVAEPVRGPAPNDHGTRRVVSRRSQSTNQSPHLHPHLLHPDHQVWLFKEARRRILLLKRVLLRMANGKLAAAWNKWVGENVVYKAALKWKKMGKDLYLQVGSTIKISQTRHANPDGPHHQPP